MKFDIRTHEDPPQKDTKPQSYKLPFGLCEKYGIEVIKEWTPHDAWEALRRKGYVSDVSEAYKEHYEKLNDKSVKQLQDEQRREIKKPEPTVIDAATGVEKLEDKPTKEFTSALTNAKAAVEKERPEDAWRVDSPSAEEFDEYHPGAKKYITQGGSTFAVTSDGDIVGVCKKPGDSKSGTDLLKMAVANGGKKLDAFSKLYDFYSKNGFEPVSWTPFDKEYAPPGWKPGYEEEPVIFWKYTGNRTSYKGLNDFLNSVEASADYDTAKNIRDKELKK